MAKIKATITKSKAKATNPKANVTATCGRSTASLPDSAESMNQHYFYEALK